MMQKPRQASLGILLLPTMPTDGAIVKRKHHHHPESRRNSLVRASSKVQRCNIAKSSAVVVATMIIGCLFLTSHALPTASAPKLLLAHGVFAAAGTLTSAENFIRGGSSRNYPLSAGTNHDRVGGISRRWLDGNDHDDDDDDDEGGGASFGEQSEISSDFQHSTESVNENDAVDPLEINEAQVNTEGLANGREDGSSIVPQDLDASPSWPDNDDDNANVSVKTETVQTGINSDEGGTANLASQEGLVQNNDDGTLTANDVSLENENTSSKQSENGVEYSNNSQGWSADDDDDDDSVSQGMSGFVNADVPVESISINPEGEALKSMADVVNNEKSSSEPVDDDDDDDNVGTIADAASTGGLGSIGNEGQNDSILPAESNESESPLDGGSVTSVISNYSNPNKNDENNIVTSETVVFDNERQSQPATPAAVMEGTDVMKIAQPTDVENLGIEGQYQPQSSVEMTQGNAASGNTNLPMPSYDDDDDDDDDDNFSTFVEGGDSGIQPQSDYSFVQDSIDESTGLPHNEVGSPSSSTSESYAGDGSTFLDGEESHVSYHREENETSSLSPEAAAEQSIENVISQSESGNLGTSEVNEEYEAESHENGVGNEGNDVSSRENGAVGVKTVGNEEASLVVENTGMSEVQETGNEINNENEFIPNDYNTNSNSVANSEGNINSESGRGNDQNTNPENAPLSICNQAAACMDCLNLAIEQLQQGMNNEPCYWVDIDGQQKCTAPSQFVDPNDNQAGAYQCAENNSAVYTGEGWDVALVAIAAASQENAEVRGDERNLPFPNQNEQSSGSDSYGDGNYWDDGDEDSFFDMVKSTLNVVALAAFFAGLLVCRSRIRERQRVNPSGGAIGAIKDELVSLIVAAVSRAASATRNEGNSGSVRASDFTATSSLNSSLSRPESNNFGQETVPLSTATDEEWGWDDDDISTPNVELSGIRRDEAKEEDDLALAIAMSLSESDAAAVAPSNGGIKTNLPTKSTGNPIQTASKSIDKKTQLPKPTPSSQLPAVATKPQQEAIKPETPPSSGQSIEDLLGQMGGNGGAVITSFGQRPPVAHAKAKPLPPKKVETEEDDIFASMGLSNFPSKPAGGVMSSSKPAPSSGGWQASSAFAAAPKSAPSPSLLAATTDDLDDADDDWGDDGDLDDLLDD